MFDSSRRKKAKSLNGLFGKPRRKKQGLGTFRPCLENLEHRQLLAADLMVTTENDDDGTDPSTVSLREAIQTANATPGPNSIKFAGSVREINLTKGELLITDDLEIRGRNAHRLTVSGNHESRVFNVGVEGSFEPTVTIDSLTIADGRADKDSAVRPGTGGGILVNAGSSLTLKRAVLDGNRSLGDKDTVISVSLVFNSIGGAVGGGIANFGTLNVIGSTFRDNHAIGADAAIRPDDFPADAFDFPGNALGGAIDNLGTATVTGSRFVGNSARAGSEGQGAFAAIAGGGGIYNDSKLDVDRSSFSNNKAVGGDEAISPSHNGHALGGALMSGTLLALFELGSGELTVSRSSFDGNLALGGNENVVSDDVSRADAPNNAIGGAIAVYQGSADITHSRLRHNQAIAGVGGADKNGGLGFGGGIAFFNFVFAVSGSVNNSSLFANRAIGGNGTAGIAGGDGLGGGIAIGSLESPFGAPGDVTIGNTRLMRNSAQGGRGGADAAGGNGQGGGVGNFDGSAVTIVRSSILFNKATGGAGGESGGAGGDGQGGGIYNNGLMRVIRSIVIGNWAIGGQGDPDGSGIGGGVYNTTSGTFDEDAFSSVFRYWNKATDGFDNGFGI